ncbi:epithelial cell adhesion molecule [Tachyglossus aculeatus]|uniref:epithelial cell adhesion molecule n=1 Tax=Tachyglossus aculeatus TaxID=9261 RepID=UPI0018F3E789|nr:epithelial cell adhesion molecule [Tachyglossus aculeatus]
MRAEPPSGFPREGPGLKSGGWAGPAGRGCSWRQSAASPPSACFVSSSLFVSVRPCARALPCGCSPPRARAPAPPMALPALGCALLLAAAAALASADEGCICDSSKLTTNCSSLPSGECQCQALGSPNKVLCSNLVSKCLQMKAEVTGAKTGRRKRPEGAFRNNDGLYDPVCDNAGVFKARQCNDTSTCWCVNTAGVRRTDKSSEITCSELVRTYWIIIELKHKAREKPFDSQELEKALKDEIQKRYKLEKKFITNFVYEKDGIIIELMQNSSESAASNVDIADVAYYFEKDIKGESFFHASKGNIFVNNEVLELEPDETLIYYVDEKAPEFSMKGLTAGVIAVIVVVVLAVVAGIVVLVVTRRKRKNRYEKAEIKEMGEMRRELNS